MGLNNHANMKDTLVSDLLRQASIKNKNQLADFYRLSWKDCQDTVISTEKYIFFYQGVPNDYCTHVTGTVAQ